MPRCVRPFTEYCWLINKWLYRQVRGQLQKQWHFRDVYTGFGVTWMRTVGLMTTYFILVDSYRRHFPELFSKPLIGPFLMSGVAATVAWWVVWPLEYMKSQVGTQGLSHGLGYIIQWNLRIKDALGQAILSSVERLSSFRGLKMNDCYGVCFLHPNSDLTTLKFPSLTLLVTLY